ncbi:MAG: hypothetical protein J6J79_07540 [Lachnospiraceae bacterium]|nr:hypothetical protein [Lachnospiraceae bacterium]
MTEIIVLVLGILVFILSYLLPAGKKGQGQKAEAVDEKQIKEIVEKEVKEAKSQIQDIVDETITYSMEKTERTMERLTNEKIMAVNEYSDTVLEQINKNHKEVVFLYDMLNDKHDNLKETVSEAVKTATEVKQTVKEAEKISIQEPFAALEPERVMPEQIIQEAAPVPQAVFETMIQEPKSDIETTIESAADVSAPEEQDNTELLTVNTSDKAERAEKAGRVDISSIASPVKGGRNSNERILELHKAGKSNMAIAKELGLGIGEVKLVIDLFEGI